jgi:autotransporter translocation and assembly factor TamB
VLVALALAAAFRGPLLGSLVVVGVRRSLGLETTIAEVGGGILSGVELRAVNVRGAAGALVSLDAGRVTATYALSALFRGKDAFLDSLEVTVDGARLDVDLTRPKAAAAHPAGEPARRPSLPGLPRLTIRDSHVRVRGPGYSFEVDGLQGTVARADAAGAQAVDLRADRFTLRHPALREGTVSVSVAGTLAPHRVAITAAKVNGEPLVERAGLELGERPGDFDLQLALRLWQGTVEAGMSRRAAGTEVRWDVRGVDVQPQQILVNPAIGALRGKLTASGSARLGSDGLASLAGTLALEWNGAVLAGRAVDHLALAASAEPGVVLVARADGRVGPNEVRLTQVRLPTAPLEAGRWRALLAEGSGGFALSLGDVPGFFALFGVRTPETAAKVRAHLLRLEGSLEKGRVELARGDLATGLGKATLSATTVTLPPDDQAWGLTAFSGSADVDLPELRELSALFPKLALSGALRADLSGSGTFARPQGSASLTGRGIVVAGRKLGDVDLRARGTGEWVEVESLQVRQGGNRLAVQAARFSPAALAGADRSRVLDGLAGSFTFRSTDIPALAALAGLPPETVARTPAAHQLTLAGTVKGRAVALTEGTFAAAGSSVTLGGARITLPGPGADWKKDTSFDGELRVDVPDLAPLSTIFRVPPLAGALAGRARVSGSAGAPSASADLSARNLSVAGHRVGDVVLKAAADPRRIGVQALEVNRGGDRLRAKGSYDLQQGTLLDLDADVSLADVAPVLAEFVRKASPVSGPLQARVSAAGPLPGGSLTLEVQLAEGRVRDVHGVRGVAKAQVDVQGTLRQPRVRVTSLAADVTGGPEGREIRAVLDAAYEPGRLLVRSLELTGAAGLSAKGEGTLPVDFAAEEILGPGPLSVRAQVSVPALERVAFLLPPAYAVTGALRASLDLSGSWKAPAARLDIDAEGLRPPPGTGFVPPDPFTFATTVAWTGSEVRIEKATLASPGLSFAASGAWSSPPPLASLLSGSGTGGALTGTLALRGSFSSPDVVWLKGALKGVQGLRGSLAGDVAVDGPAGSPQLSGAVRITGGALRFEDLPLLDAVTATASLAGRKVTLGEVRGNVGGSPFTLAGSVDLANLGDPVVDLELKGTNALLYRAEGLRVRADSDLTLRGPVSALALAGEVALTDSVYQRSFAVADLLPSGGKGGAPAKRSSGAGISFPDPPLRTMRLDVHLTAHEPFRIATSAVQGTARPELRLAGTGLLPVLRGPILFDALQVALPSGTMEFEHGTLIFNDSDLARSLIDFVGRMQTQGLEITAQVGGTIEEPEIVLSSIPPVLNEELVLFVLTGAPPGSATASGGYVGAMATPMAVYLGKGVVEKLLGGNTGGGGGLQGRLEVQVGRELTRSGGMTAESRLLVRKNLLREGTSLYLTGEKDVYDQQNVGMRLLFKFK